MSEPTNSELNDRLMELNASVVELTRIVGQQVRATEGIVRVWNTGNGVFQVIRFCAKTISYCGILVSAIYGAWHYVKTHLGG